MPALGIVEPLNVIEHIGPGFIAGSVDLSICTLGLQRGEEAFHGGIVPAVAPATHAALDSLVREQLLKRLAGVLAALVGVMQYGRLRPTSPNRHQQGIGDELGGHLGGVGTGRDILCGNDRIRAQATELLGPDSTIFTAPVRRSILRRFLILRIMYIM